MDMLAHTMLITKYHMLFVKFVLLSVISNNLFMHQIHSFIMSDKILQNLVTFKG